MSAFPAALVALTTRIPHIFRTVRKKGILFHFWAVVVTVGFLLASNVLARKETLARTFAVMESDQVVRVAESLAPYTHVSENADQIRIILTGDSFIGSNTPGALPSEYTHTIAKGETLASVASSYNVYVSDILNLNGIKPEDAARVKIGQVVHIPAEAGDQDLTWLSVANEARRRAEEQARLAAARSSQTILTRGARGSNIEVMGRQARGSNTYPFGWCTYWVASKRYVPPRWGNAKNWLNSARAAGWATGSEPRVGAIVVTTDNRFYGHVAYVEGVSEGSITISEMNYVRWGVANTRTVPRNSGIIRGYIY